MGENQHDSPARIAKGLSSRMLGVLGTASDTRYGSQHVLGSAVTTKALKIRGLINEQHYLTDLGRRVAYAAGVKVMLLDELHAEANADPRQHYRVCCASIRGRDHLSTCPTVPPAPKPSPTSRPIADGAGDFRHGESVIVAQGDGRVWQIDDLRETLGGERFATMTHTGRSPLDTSHTAVPLGRLRHVAPVATSQPATSQIEQQLADLAELIRTVRRVDPDLSRAVERAKYDALRTVLRVLTGWIEGSRENCEALGHRGESREQACGQQFTPEDIRRMVNDAAREVGVREPWAPEVTS